MRLILTSILSLAVSISFAQDPLPRASIILNGHTPAEFKEAVGALNSEAGIEVLRHQNPVIRFQYASEETRINAMQLLYSRDYNITTKSGLPVDFPMLAPNATEDEQAAFEQQKADWIENNPERYEEMLENMQQNNGITVISQEEFDQMPEDKKQHILTHPELYSVE